MWFRRRARGTAAYLGIGFENSFLSRMLFIVFIGVTHVSKSRITYGGTGDRKGHRESIRRLSPVAEHCFNNEAGIENRLRLESYGICVRYYLHK